jgi:hypothetical protein
VEYIYSMEICEQLVGVNGESLVNKRREPLKALPHVGPRRISHIA